MSHISISLLGIVTQILVEVDVHNTSTIFFVVWWVSLLCCGLPLEHIIEINVCIYDIFDVLPHVLTIVTRGVLKRANS